MDLRFAITQSRSFETQSSWNLWVKSFQMVYRLSKWVDILKEALIYLACMYDLHVHTVVINKGEIKCTDNIY